MRSTKHHIHVRLAIVAAGAGALAFAAMSIAGTATATTEPVGTEPTETAAADAGTEPMDSMAMTPGSLAVEGSGEATSPEAEAFCTAELAAESAANSEDQAAMESAFSALVEAAPDDIRAAAEAVVANAEAGPGDPAFDEAYTAVIDYMRGNCGYNEMDTEGGDYYFTGVPSEMPAGPVIVTLDNVGAELHVIEFARINDDVTLTAEEILALPEEEAMASVEMVGAAFAMPGMTGYGVVDLTAGRYLALCPIPQGLTPEVAAQMPPEGGETEGSPAGSMPMDTATMDTMMEGSAPMDTMMEGSAPMDTMMEGSAPIEGALGPPHFTLGMWQEITVS